MTYRRYKLENQLDKVIKQVSKEIRESHQRAVTIGRRSRGTRILIPNQQATKPASPIFEILPDEDDAE